MNLRIFILTFLLSTFILSADELTYKPINPSFGGNSYNANWLLQSALIQNKTKPEEKESQDYTRSPLVQFQENLNRQILRKLANSIVDKIYDDDGINVGKYSVGDYLIDIENNTDAFVVIIDDMATGNQTLLEIPHF